MKKKPIPEGWEKGHPPKDKPGNYLINGQKTLLFWDGQMWHRATKDFSGDYTWHEHIRKQPVVKYFQLKRIIYAIKQD